MKHVHVVPKNKQWAVKTEKSSMAVKLTKTQKEAIEIGKDLAKKNESELLIHGKDGKIREKNSYGNDPRKIKG